MPPKPIERIVGGAPAAFYEQIASDLESTNVTPQLAQRAMEFVGTYGDSEEELTESMLQDAWAQTRGVDMGLVARDPGYRALRAALTYARIARSVRDETALCGGAATSLKRLLSADRPFDTGATLQAALGGDVVDVRSDRRNERIYFPTAGIDRGAYMAQEGFAILYRHGDSWDVSIGSDERYSIPTRATPHRRLEKLLIDLAALIETRLSVDAPKDDLVEAGRDVVSPDHEANHTFLEAALDAIYGAFGQVRPKIEPTAGAEPQVDAASIPTEAVNLFREFVEERPETLRGKRANNPDYLADRRAVLQEKLVGLVQWIEDGMRSASVDTVHHFETASPRAQARMMVQADDGFVHQDIQLDDVPRGVMAAARELERQPEQLISIAGPHRTTPGRALTGASAVELEGRAVGTIIWIGTYDNGGSIDDRASAIVFDANDARLGIVGGG